MTATANKEFIHALHEKYYVNRVEQKDRAICIKCGEPRVLGQRGEAKGKCKGCRKEAGQHEDTIA